jgi:uncharacterized protein YndB with AHSA1/START domain
MNEMSAEAKASPDREIVISRLIDAPQDLVFEAFTDQKHVSKWWGPNGFTTTTLIMDLRPGGIWRFVMHGPDGRDYQNLVTYLEISKPKRLVYEHSGLGDTAGIKFHATVTFKPVGGKTEVTLRSVFPTAAERDHVVKERGAIEGGKQTLERLDRHVGSLARAGGKTARPAVPEFVISRIFDAPRELVWKANSELEALKQWWGPKGFKWKAGSLDFRPGGMFHYGLVSPTGQEMWGRFIYREIVPQEKIVSVVSFSDPQGGITRHPMSPDWPAEMLNTATFTERGGKTVLTLRSSPLNASEAENRIFFEGFKSMEGGYTGTLDQLDAYLATLR